MMDPFVRGARVGDGFRISEALGSDVFHLDDADRATKRWISLLPSISERRFPSPTGR
jgi:hypothetical protein